MCHVKSCHWQTLFSNSRRLGGHQGGFWEILSSQTRQGVMHMPEQASLPLPNARSCFCGFVSFKWRFLPRNANAPFFLVARWWGKGACLRLWSSYGNALKSAYLHQCCFVALSFRKVLFRCQLDACAVSHCIWICTTQYPVKCYACMTWQKG